jgi:uncharacterized protein with PhoU and TrkA domain
MRRRRRRSGRLIAATAAVALALASALCGSSSPLAAAATAPALPRARAKPTNTSDAEVSGAAFHAARDELLRREYGLAAVAGGSSSSSAAAAATAAPTPRTPPHPPSFISIVGARDALADDPHPPAAAIRHPSFNASAPPDVAGARSQFVRRAAAGNGSGGLHLGDGPRPWVAVGLSWPDAVLMAIEEEEEVVVDEKANKQPSRRRQALSALLRALSRAGFNAMRVLALPRGAQPAPGAVSAAHLDALDWLVAESRAHGLRLLLVLADGAPPPLSPSSSSPPASHAREYAAWVAEYAQEDKKQQPPLPLSTLRGGFFGDDAVKSLFLDAAAAVAGRRNAKLDPAVAYRHDPTVLGYELLAGAHPGCCCGDKTEDHDEDPASSLRGWARQAASFLRRKDPHHVIVLGGDGLFGASSPHLARAFNPRLPLPADAWPCGGGGGDGNSNRKGSSDASSSSSPQPPWTPADSLHDWHDLTSSVPELDLAMTAVAPERFAVPAANDPLPCRKRAWGRGAEAEDDGSGGACPAAADASSSSFSWARGWVRAHQRDALRLQRPLMLTVEVGSSSGSQLQTVAEDVMRAAGERRAPTAGVFVGLAGPGGWRDGSGTAALLRRAMMMVEGGEDAVVAQVDRLLASGAAEAEEEEREASGADGWRRFYHGRPQAAAKAAASSPAPPTTTQLDATAAEVLRAVGKLSAWLKKHEEQMVVAAAAAAAAKAAVA